VAGRESLVRHGLDRLRRWGSPTASAVLDGRLEVESPAGGGRLVAADIRSDRDGRSVVQATRSPAGGDACILDPVSHPTVVLVHGAFADASCWTGVIVELQAAGIPVLAPPNPLRSLDGDAEYIAERVRQIDGPVLLVGHSYGGGVITVAGAGARNVVGLVYVAAFIPDEGESLGEIGARFPPSRLDEVVRQNTFPLDGTGKTAVELSIAPAEYPAFFLPGSPPEVAAAAAVSQRPLAASALLADTAPAAAWRTLPSWAIIPTGDESIHPDALRFMAERAGAQTVEVPGPHLVMVYEPRLVADRIRDALREREA
jgi:pimeloyl-ACP methyl ester carboxylesterase